MIRLNVQEAKTHLSRYLDRVAEGETVILCRRNVPIAEIRPIRRRAARRPPPGLFKGQVVIPPSFFDPLPDEDLDAWEGR